MVSKRLLQQQALAISFASIVYNAIEGGVSIGFGSESSSRSLVFFGIQSGIEVISAVLVVWRFRNVAKPGEEAHTEISPTELRFEKIATLSIAGLLLCLSVGTEVSSIVSLALHHEPDSSNTTLIISSTALVIMILIWLPKRYLARALNSSTMQGEATCSLSCIQITTVLLVGAVIFRAWKGGWWIDGATSIILGLLFGWEGVKMAKWALNPEFKGGCCEDCRPSAKLSGDDAELGTSYRDICECCKEKEECRNGDICKCPADADLACCKPVSDGGAKCCTREVHFGLPNSVAAGHSTGGDALIPCRDICDCCVEKDACRNSEECKCAPDVESVCCKPVTDTGGKCCTREVRPGPRAPSATQHEIGTSVITEVKPGTTAIKDAPKGCCDSCCD